MHPDPPLKAYIACSNIVVLLWIWNVYHVISRSQQVKRAIAPNLDNIGQGGGWCSFDRLLPCMLFQAELLYYSLKQPLEICSC